MKFLLSFFLLTSFAQAFTLNNNFGGTFKNSKVKVFIANDTVCQQGITIYDLEGWIKPAVNNFWNEVPTSRLRLEPAGFYDNFPININTAILCSPTDLTCLNTTASGKELIPAVKDIVIACNRDLANFNGSPEVLAVAVPNSFSGKKIKGAVILINDASPAFKNLSEADKIAVLAHEIGHAIGLGHPKDHPEALMHFKTVNLRRNLAQDDIDGVTYLYPKQVDACGLFGGFGGTINTGSKGPALWQMFLALAIMVLLMELRKLASRFKKAGSPA